jgi:hypothetical protein
MGKYFTSIGFILFIMVLAQVACMAASIREQHDILSSAESLFKVMKEKDYPKIWFHLSIVSRNSIIDATYKNILKHEKEKGRETNISKEQIEQDFSVGGLIAKGYWESYLHAFNPDMVLEQSKWEMGKIGKDRAYINVTYKKAERPAVIQMFKEDGSWKVGLMETFKAVQR